MDGKLFNDFQVIIPDIIPFVQYTQIRRSGQWVNQKAHVND